MKHLCMYFCVAILLAFVFQSCLDDEHFSTNTSHSLSFSQDTISFDTVFTSVGSVTMSFKVYNRNDENLKISEINLSGGSNSVFKMNVDGLMTSSLKNVEIKAKDSLFVFVQVKINPQDENSPLLIEDSIVFFTNSNKQKVRLMAYGQDVFLFKAKKVLNDTVLLGEKPYLIYGDLCVDSAKTLTINKNSKLYFHKNARLIVNGNLIVNGTLEEPVVFRGDRLDYLLEKYRYDDLSGQWGGIFLSWDRGNHHISYASIRNAQSGIKIDSGNTEHQPVLFIENSIIHNMDSCGVSSKMSDIKIVNSVVSNCAQHCLKLVGGKNEIAQSTIVNYYHNFSVNYSRSKPSVYITNYELDDAGAKIDYLLNKALFLNTIVYGSFPTELVLDENPDIEFSVNFSDCLLKMQEEDNDKFVRIIWNESPLFASVKLPYDFKLTNASPARGMADLDIASQYLYDIVGSSRFLDNLPDLGAYEYVEE